MTSLSAGALPIPEWSALETARGTPSRFRAARGCGRGPQYRRIGATQDLLALNIDLASVMQAGRWKSAAMPMTYGEEVLAARGGMARAAAAQGRDTHE